MKSLLVFIFTLSYTYSFGCSCATPGNKEELAKMIENADIVVEGTPNSLIKHNISSKKSETMKKEGINILFNVTSVIKGNLKKKMIAINQGESRNCAQLYKIGNRYLVLGYEIKGFKSKKKQYNSAIKSNINLPPPPGGEIDKNGILTSFNYDKVEVDYWEILIKTYKVYTTTSCSTFHPNSEIAKMIRKQQLSIMPKKN